MLRLRLRNDDSEPAGRRCGTLTAVLIVSGASGAAVVATAYPAVGFSLNVGATVLAALYAVTRNPAQVSPGEHEPADSEGDERPEPGKDQQD